MYFASKFSFEEKSAPLAPPIIKVGSKVILVGDFSHQFGSVVRFVNGALANSASEHKVVEFYFLTEAGLARCC